MWLLPSWHRIGRDHSDSASFKLASFRSTESFPVEDASLTALEDTDTHPFLYYSDGDADVSEESDEAALAEIEKSETLAEKSLFSSKVDGVVTPSPSEIEKEEGKVCGLFDDVMKKRVYHFEVPCTSHASVTRDPQTIQFALQFIQAIQLQYKSCVWRFVFWSELFP